MLGILVQAEVWREMLRAETTVCDVIFDLTSNRKEVINIRAETWTENPLTITGKYPRLSMKIISTSREVSLASNNFGMTPLSLRNVLPFNCDRA